MYSQASGPRDRVAASRFRSRRQIQRLIDRAGVLDPRGRVCHTGIEELESRVLLTGFNPGGAGVVGMDMLAAPRALAPADVSTFDINGAGAGQYDTVSINSGGSLDLSGILRLNFGAITLSAGDVFTLFNRSAGSGAITGAFLAIDGLAGVGGGGGGGGGMGRNLVALQSPLRLLLVATDLPSADATIVVNADADLAALITFFSTGAGSPTTTGGVYAFGQHFNGELAFAGDASALTIGLADGTFPADAARITTASAGGANVYSAFGAASFTLRPRTDATAPGLRLDPGFAPTGYALGDSIASVSPGAGASGRLGPFTFTSVTPALTGFIISGNSATVVAGLTAQSLSLAFPGSGTANPGGATVTAETVTAALGVSLQLSGSSIVHASGNGRLSISAATLDAEIPGVVTAHAQTIVLGYDPDAGREQELLSIESMTVEMPKLGLTGSVAASPANPGLVIRGDGFQFGTFSIGPANATDFVQVASSPLWIRNWRFSLTDFGMTFPLAGAPIVSTPLGIAFSVDAFEVRGLASGTTASGENIVASVIVGANGPTGYALTAGALNLDVPGVLAASATGVGLTYTPGQDRSDPLFFAETMTIDVPRLHLRGSVTPSAGNPGLTIRGDGFLFGNLTVTLDTSTFGSSDPDGYLVLGSALRIKNPSVTLTGFGLTVPAAGLPVWTLTSVTMAADGIKIGTPASPFRAEGAGLSATVALNGGNPEFSFAAESVSINLPHILVFGTSIAFDPQGASGYLLRVDGTVGATVMLPGATITGEIGHFQINAAGEFEALSGFSVAIAIGDVGGLGNVLGGVKFPGFLIPSAGTFTADVTVTWPNFSAHPERFMVDLTAAFGVSFGPNLTISADVQHLIIDTAKLFESPARNPFVGWTSFGGTVNGNVAGAAITANLVVGIVRFDLSGAPYPTSTVVTDPDQISDSILYFGVQAGIMLMDQGAELYFGVSERGFLQAYVRADADIPLGNTSLVLTGFRGGVTFNATQLPDISDPVDLRAPIFQPPGRLSFDQWKDSLRQLVINQKAGHGAVFFEADGMGQTWAAMLDAQPDPGLYLPAGLRTAFLQAGIAITRTPGAATLTALSAGSLWLLRDTTGEYLIEKSGDSFSVSGINFSLDGAFIPAFPSTPGGSTTADTISYTDPDGAHTLVQAFAAMRIPLSPSATLTKAASGDEWEIDDNGINYRISLKGADAPVLSVMGGESPLGSGGAGVFRIDAGFTLTSTGGDQAWRIDADAIVTIGATITDTRIVLLGALEVGPESAPTMRVDAKLYLTLAHALDTPTARVDMFLLVDFIRPPSAAEMAAMGGPSIPYLSLYGHVILSLPTGPGGSLGIRLEGSSTEGLAVFDTAGLTGGAFADQKFRLGGLGAQQAYLEITLADSRLEFSYYVNLGAEGIITAASLGQSAGHLVVEFANVDLDGDSIGDAVLPVNLYGAAKLSVTSHDISALQTAGISGDLLATLKVNTSGSDKSVTLDRTFDNSPGTTEIVMLKATSLALFAGATLTFEPRVNGAVIASKTIVGVFSLEVTPTDLNLLILGTVPIELPVGPLAVPLQGEILGVLVLKRNDNGSPLNPFDDSFTFGARLEIGIESRTGEFIHFDLELRMFMNSTGTNLAVSLPEDFFSRFGPPTGPQQSLLDRLTFNPSTHTFDAVIPQGPPSLTFNPATYNPGNPGDQIDFTGPYIAIIGIGDFTLGNEADFGLALAMHGNVRLLFGYDNPAHAATFFLGVNANLSLAPLGALTANGSITIIAGVGPGGAPLFSTWGGFQLAGSVTIGQLSLSAAISIDINTSDTPRQVPHYFNPATYEPQASPTLADMPPGMRLFAGGKLRWNGADIVRGQFTFATTPSGFSMAVAAELALDPIAGIAVVGALDLYTSGDAVGFLSITADIDLLGGFTFTGHSFVQFNTKDSPETLHLPYATGASATTDILVPANTLEIYVDGRLGLFGGLLSLDGTFHFLNNPAELSISVDAALSLGSFFDDGPGLLSIGVNGSAKLFKTTGVLLVDIGINDLHLGIPHLVTLDLTSMFFQLNTSSTTSLTSAQGHLIAPGMKLAGSLGLSVVGISLGSVNTFIAYEPTAPFHQANGDWHLHADFHAGVLGIAGVNGVADFYSRGAFYVHIDGGVSFGDEWFGAGFSAAVTISFLAQNSADQNVLDSSDLMLSGSFSGEAHAGIVVWGYFIGVSLGASGTFNYNGATKELSVTVCADFGDLIGSICGTFSLGSLDFQSPPPPPRLAGPGIDAPWNPSVGGVLYLNVGAKAAFRDISETVAGERYSVEALGAGSAAGQRIRVTGFGLVQDYDNVTGIVADFAGDADYFFAGRAWAAGDADLVAITVPITVTGGDNNDTIVVRSRGVLNIHGNNGNDFINASGAGGSIYGDSGDDAIAWRSGSEAAVTLDGGSASEVNAVQVFLTTGADRVRVDRPATGFLVERVNAQDAPLATIAASNFMILTLSGDRGADDIRLAHLVGTGLLKVIVDLSQYDTGATTSSTVGGVTTTRRVFASDHDADTLTIEGSSSADAMSLATGPDTDDLDGDNNTTERMLAVNLPDDATAVFRYKVYNSIRADGDAVAINAGAGADSIDASAVSDDLAALTLGGGAGSDTITGSPFADTISGGPGNNLLYGGPGNDAIDAGNGDNYIEGGPGLDTITTGSGNDTIDGGAGNDTIDSGLGDDTVTGGLGTDTYIDAGGRDTLVETRSGAFRDLTITDDTLIVGTALPGGPIDFSDRYSIADEVENLAGIFEVAVITGSSAANRFAVGDVDGSVLIGGVPRAVSRHWSGVITLDGLDGSDLYLVTVFGDRGAVVNVLDTGSAASGIDRLIVFGADSAADPDTFLIRATFIASVKDADADLVSDTLDRINFNAALEPSTPAANDAVVINGLAGDDRFISDDTSVPTTLSGGEGRDYFQFGQLFGALRSPPFVAAGDAFATTAVDLTPAGSSTHITGHLSNGASFGTTANGGNGEDTFFVNRTMALLFLKGDDGNDAFTIRAFALDGTTNFDQSTTNVSGGTGDDSIEYAADAPIDIDGGEGIDAIRILGTQFGDRFRIAASGITLLSASGPTPLVVTFVGVESLELHAGDGADSVYIVGTSPLVRTLVFGGGGGDRFYFGLDPLDPAAPRTLTGIAGPVLIDGGPGDPTIFGLSTPVMLPAETNIALPPGAGSMSDHELPGDIDIIDIDASDETRDLSGAMGPRVWPLGSTTTLNVITLSGLALGADLVQDSQTVPGGISLRNLEVADARLGSGNETIAVSAVLPMAITLLAGNGGGDTFNVSAPDAPGAMLVLYGDSRPGQALPGSPGNDRIDARSSTLAATIDAGPGNDVVLAGSGADRIAGGSGDDVIAGGPGNNLIIGDSRFIVDRLTRTTTIITSGLSDSDLPGNDTINPGGGEGGGGGGGRGGGFNIVFGDHGLVAQDFNPAGTFAQFGFFTSALTVRPTIGGADTISARASAHPQFAGLPSLSRANDLIFGGAGADTIDSGDGNDWIIGDHASVAIAPPIDPIVPDLSPPPIRPIPPTSRLVGPMLPVRLIRALAEEPILGVPSLTINSTDALDGAGDTIDSGAGDDVIIGGVGSDAIDAGSGDDVVLGDHGRYDPAAPIAGRFVSTFSTLSAAGGDDHILAGPGNDIAMGQQGADAIFGQEGDDDLIGGHNVPGGLDAPDSLDGGAGNDAILGDNGAIVRTPGALSPRMVTPSGALLPGLTTPSAYDANLDPAVSPGAPNPAGSATIRTISILDASPATSPSLFGNDLIAGGAGDDLILAGNGNDAVRGDGRVIDGPTPTLVASIDSSTDGDDYIEGNAGNDTIHGDLGQDDLVGGGSSLFGLAPAQRADGSDTIFGGDGTQTLPGSLGDTSPTGAARDADVIAGDNADILRLVAADGSPLWYNYDAGAAQRIAPRVVRLLDYTPDGLPTGDAGAPDAIHGESGDDVIYGMAGNDTLYGDGQNDDLIGGSGDDWIYGGTGNDGVLGDDGRILTARAGVAEPLLGLAASTQQLATTPDALFAQTVLATGTITKHARLQAPSAGGADAIYGGLGDDFLHGGGGMDAISGAEALADFAAPPAVRPTLSFNVGLRRFTAFNPGFAAQRILGFFLNFDAGTLSQPINDGADIIFGGDDHDWLVGGTGSDRLYGGMGDDVLCGDDNLDTVNGLNSIADVGPSASPDILFGGAGLDRLIGNAAHDRLIDWNGEFNQYILPFAPAYPTVTKSYTTSLVLALQTLGHGSGADPRLVEPGGELGIVLGTDAGWFDQYGRQLI